MRMNEMNSCKSWSLERHVLLNFDRFNLTNEYLKVLVHAVVIVIESTYRLSMIRAVTPA